MISIKNRAIFINGVQSVNPELIGYALLDYAETIENDGTSITLKEQDVFIENDEVLSQLTTLTNNN